MKTYRQLCGLAKALDIVGERWTLLIVRDLLVGPMRYGDLMASLEGITTNLLAKRLKHLEAHNLVERTELPPPSRVAAYQLTDRGRELWPAVSALAKFGTRYIDPTNQDRRNIRWFMVSMMRRFRGTGEAVDIGVVVRDGDEVIDGYSLRSDGETLEVRQAAPSRSEVAVISGAAMAIVGVMIGRDDPFSTVGVAVDGDAEALRTFLSCLGPM